MPVMFCYIDPFVVNQQVIRLTPEDTEVIFRGGLGEACNFMAAEYQNQTYDKILLKGAMAEEAAEKIHNVGSNLFGLNNIEIEVMK